MLSHRFVSKFVGVSRNSTASPEAAAKGVSAASEPERVRKGPKALLFDPWNK